MSIAEERPLRADARRNREAILVAAKAVLSKQGIDAQMDDIARRAKVGVGTVYRHFPTKEALIKALIADRQAQILANVREGLEDEDPWRGLCTSLRKGGELGARDRALSEAFAEHMSATEAPGELLEAADELVRKCQAAGAVRPDFRATDIPMFMCGLMQAMHKMSPDGRTPGPWQRHLQIILDGIRARPDLEPLPD
jgi:AcrR family transcriptional regulator